MKISNMSINCSKPYNYYLDFNRCKTFQGCPTTQTSCTKYQDKIRICRTPTRTFSQEERDQWATNNSLSAKICRLEGLAKEPTAKKETMIPPMIRIKLSADQRTMLTAATTSANSATKPTSATPPFTLTSNKSIPRVPMARIATPHLQEEAEDDPGKM